MGYNWIQLVPHLVHALQAGGGVAVHRHHPRPLHGVHAVGLAITPRVSDLVTWTNKVAVIKIAKLLMF